MKPVYANKNKLLRVVPSSYSVRVKHKGHVHSEETFSQILNLQLAVYNYFLFNIDLYKIM